MTDEVSKPELARANERSTKIAARAESIIAKILRNNSELRAVRETMRRGEEPSDKFAREFLKVFRQRMQGGC